MNDLTPQELIIISTMREVQNIHGFERIVSGRLKRAFYVELVIEGKQKNFTGTSHYECFRKMSKYIQSQYA